MLKKSNLKMYREVRGLAVRKNRWSVLGGTLLPQSVILKIILAVYWVIFLGFVGHQIYHRQFLLYLSAMFLGPLVQIYTLLFIFNYIKSKAGLTKIAKSPLVRGVVEQVNELADYNPGRSTVFKRIQIRLPDRETILTPSFSEKFPCEEGSILHLFLKHDRPGEFYGMVESNACTAVIFDKNFAVKNFIESFGKHLSNNDAFLQKRSENGVVLPLERYRKALSSL